jgi:iodotyrosine deiodinase
MKGEDYIFINGFKHTLYESESVSKEDSIKKSKEFFKWIDTRRSVREYSSQPVSKQVIENIIKSASTAPSGAHK